MLDTNIHAAPQLEPCTPSRDSAWEREHRAFQKLLPRLIPQYRGQYVAIHQEQVIDHDVSDVELVQRVIAERGCVSLHVGLVTDESRPPARVPSARLPRDTR